MLVVDLKSSHNSSYWRLDKLLAGQLLAEVHPKTTWKVPLAGKGPGRFLIKIANVHFEHTKLDLLFPPQRIGETMTVSL